MYTKHYISIVNGILNLKDMPSETLIRRVALVSVASAFKFGYVAIDETNATFNGFPIFSMVAKDTSKGTLIEIITKNE